MKKLTDLNHYRVLFNETNNFIRYLGAELTMLEEGYAQVEMVTREEHRNMNDSVHGGVLMALADTAAGAASKTYGYASVTLEGKMNFLRPVPINGKPVRVTAKAVHAGRRTGVYECNIYDSDNQLAAMAVYTMFMMEEPLF
ncbi:PaaI family thioesterase [Enterocloster bolteae]|uniref:PaaI family thioesterase n=1 Tax=Enterocloster bolteae TaxID=208479 RepID=UPI0028DC2440|nr:PaaI family thioesterase [Enterocloster bolteae]